MVSPAKRPFLLFIHYFRAIAIVFVLGGHIIINWDLNKSYLQKSILDAFWQNGTILFIFIAGFLFQYLSHNYKYTSYLKKKLKVVVLPYLLMSIPAILLRLYISAPEDVYNAFPTYFQWTTTEKIGFFLITGTHLLPYWFVPMIILYYLSSPLLIRLDRNPTYYWLLIPLIAISLFIARANRGELHLIHINAIHFMSIYVFGMLCSRYINTLMHLGKRYLNLSLVLYLLALIGSVLLYDHMFYDALNYLNKTFLCLFLVFFISRHENSISGKSRSFLNTMANYSFGLYFIHYYIFLGLKMILSKVQPTLLEGTVINWFAILIVVFILSMGSTYLIKKVTSQYSKYFIGA